MTDPIPISELSDDELIVTAWRAGDLSWILLDHQVPWYEKFRRWERRDPAKEPGQYTRIANMDFGKRVGKTSGRITARMEDAIRAPEILGRPGFYRYVTAFQKDIDEIVGQLLPILLETCPLELRPRWKGAGPGRPGGLYFSNGSIIAMAGLDKHPDALRGRASDGDDVSEAAFIRGLKYTIKNVLYHSYQQRPHARMYLESSAPKEVDSEYDEIFVADAKARSCTSCANGGRADMCEAPNHDCPYQYATIDDNTALSDEEREEFIRAAGGRDDPECQREYFNIRGRDEKRALVPEFVPERHVVDFPIPEWHVGFVGADSGMRDLMALVFGVSLFEMGGKLGIVADWTGANAATAEVAEVCKTTEKELWADVPRWDGRRILPPGSQPYRRVCDTDARLIHDLSVTHGLTFEAARKVADGARPRDLPSEAGLHALRDAFRRDLILVHPRCQRLIAHLTSGRWNDNRTDWHRHEIHGHFDLVAALLYLWRVFEQERNFNPVPPPEVLDPTLASEPWLQPTARSSTALPANTRETLRAIRARKGWRPTR